ncbi:XRE family transcriptional regulator [Streptomyces sp. SID3343]|nr:XRE family transcriptional regulator [Streptomyces sp. SID3343]MYW06256.1 XRE family transcriptional regulator [Streptomyces sp. SID3343]
MLARRLEHLFATVHPRDRGPYSTPEAVELINEMAGETVMGATYMWQLRTGRRDDPTHSRLNAVAKFFGVSVTYFYDDAVAERTDAQLAMLTAVRDAGVRSIALRANGLSPESQAAVTAMLDRVRLLEGLPQPAEDPGPVE